MVKQGPWNEHNPILSGSGQALSAEMTNDAYEIRDQVKCKRLHCAGTDNMYPVPGMLMIRCGWFGSSSNLARRCCM